MLNRDLKIHNKIKILKKSVERKIKKMTGLNVTCAINHSHEDFLFEKYSDILLGKIFLDDKFLFNIVIVDIHKEFPRVNIFVNTVLNDLDNLKLVK